MRGFWRCGRTWPTPTPTAGHALSDLYRFGEALASYDQALAIRPDHFEALNGGRACWCDWSATRGRRRLRKAVRDQARCAEPGATISPAVAPWSVIGPGGRP